MKSQKEVKKTLTRLSKISIDKSYYRFIGVEYINDPLSAIGSLTGGRYNRKETFEILYMAIREAEKSVSFKIPPKVIITIDVKVDSILDLKDKNIIKKMGINLDKLFDPWRLPPIKKESYTQTLGRLVYESGRFEGISYPSVIVKNKYNLAIFPDRLKKNSKIETYDPDKIMKQIIKKDNA